MVWRVVLGLVAVLAIALFAFFTLLRGEVDRIVAIHASDKAQHLIDMLAVYATSPDHLLEAAGNPAFLRIARGRNVATVRVYGPNGVLRLETVTPNPPDPAMLPADDGTQSLSNAYGTALIQRQHEVRSWFGPPTSISHSEKMGYLTAAPPPSSQDLQPLLNGMMEAVISRGTLLTDDGLPLDYGLISLPAYSSTGELVGIVSFTMGTSDITGTMKEGVLAFGIAFGVLGAILFGIPASGFWLQRRLAERSARDVGFLSSHDTLTNLLNRKAFNAQVDDLIAKGEISHIGFIDVDRFKNINDNYGHSVGDTLLIHIADLLRDVLGEDSLIARFGGDEFTFAVLRRDAFQIEGDVERLRHRATHEVSIEGFSIRTSLSIGLAKFDPSKDTDLEGVLRHADTALYAAKSQGRNHAAIYDDTMGEAARKRRALEHRIREACASGDLALAYQPLVCAQSETTIGYEALLRLKHNDGTPIPPSEFIPIAEEIGLIEEMGNWVLFNAMREISALNDTSSVSINLSAEQFKSGKLVGQVADALKASRLPPHRLELEITESVLLKHEERIEHQIDALKEMGLSIAMDDFGTGFSSLSTLWRYGFDRIKIDKSFIDGLEDAPIRSRKVIDSIILLGSRMGMSITAEGIETEKQRDLLKTLGCDVLQGFYFGRPCPLESPAYKADARAAG